MQEGNWNAYSFMLRPIIAEEEAVFRCSSKAEAAIYKDLVNINIIHNHV